MEIISDFEKLSLHDVSIEDVSRLDSTIIMVVSGVFVSKEHPSSNGYDCVIQNGVFTIYNVSSEKSLSWIDTFAPVPNETPEYPIDEIMHAEFTGNTFHLDGFKETTPWHEWFIEATGFKLLAIKSVGTTS
ncbi:hypothetical protein [Vibrio parahaemolyticus]|uniref:hypothetical protein n=1 Tax=Vibrio parahaemolyticus TaxID=670 RepID=UPI0009B7001C|nr:hypothetical protein [Vibrio parahaemolyticus]OQK29778.1 hypothetical protein XE88_c11707 [Vibrio parahaemolyticus]